MVKVYNSIQVDVNKKNSFKAISTKQLDYNSRFLKIELVDKGQHFTYDPDLEVVFVATRDGESKAFATEKEGDLIIAPLTSWVLAEDGYVDCEIVLVNGTQQLSSFNFSLDVEKNLYTNEDVEADENYDLLVKLIGDVRGSQIVSITETVEGLVHTYKVLFGDGHSVQFQLKDGKDGQGSVGGVNDVKVDGVSVVTDGVANIPKIPTKTSDLTNDSGFVSDDDLDTHEYNATSGSQYGKDLTVGDLIDGLINVDQTKLKAPEQEGATGQVVTYKNGDVVWDNPPVTDVKDNNGTSLLDGTVAKLPIIPSKTSELDNDSAFVKNEELDSRLYPYEYEGETYEATVADAIITGGLAYNGVEELSSSKADKTYVDGELGTKQDQLTSKQLANINDVPNKASKDYVDEQISTVEMAKFPNATIIGTPTINNGQISNFTRNNYLKFPFLVNFQNRPFTINFDITTGANVVSQENILDSDFGLAFAIRNSRFVIAISTNGTSWNLGEGVGTLTVQPNSSYRIAISWNGTQYTVAYSVNGGETYTDDIVIASNQAPYTKQMFIGVGENFEQVVNSFSGIINLNYANLIIADKIVWQGMDDVGIASRLAIDLSNIDSAGEQRINDIVAETKEYIEDSPSKQELVTLTLVDNYLYIANGFVNGFKLPTDFTGLCVIKLTTGTTAPTIDVTGLICAGEFATTAIGANETWDISIDGNQVVGAKFVERSAS